MYAAPLSAVSLVMTLAGSVVAGPLNEGLLPPNPAFVLHVDVDAAKGTALGRYVIENHEKFNLQGLDGLKAFGVEPFRDFHSVTVCAPASKPAMGVVMVESDKSIDALINHLKTEPHAKTMTVDGVEVLSWDDNGTRKYAHIKPGKDADTRLVSICDDWEVLTRTLKDAGTGAPAGAGPRAGSIFFFRTSDLAALTVEGDDDNAEAIFSGASNASLEAGEEGGKAFVHASVQCDQPQTAADLKEVVGGVLAFARMMPRGNPDARPLADATRPAKVVAEGRLLTLDAQWSPPDAAKALETLAAMNQNKEEGKKADSKD